MDLAPEPPALDRLVDAADHGLHPWVHGHVPEHIRRAALAEELGFWVNTAAQDMSYAADYQRGAPQSGAPASAYLDRWLELATGGQVLAGPRYLGMDPDLPFVGVSASERPLTSADRAALTVAVTSPFEAFGPGFVLVTTSEPLGAWPDTRPERRQVVGLVGVAPAGDAARSVRIATRGHRDLRSLPGDPRR